MAVLLGTWNGRPITISVKPNCLTVSVERARGEPDVYSYDYAAKLTPLTPAERLAQGEQIERRLRFSQAGGVPHISRYDIREFVY